MVNNEVMDEQKILKSPEAIPYFNLAKALGQFIANQLSEAPHRDKNQSLINGLQDSAPENIRTSPVWQALELIGVEHKHLVDCLLKPIETNFIYNNPDRKTLSRNVIGPLLRVIRRGHTIEQVCLLVGINTPVTYHYWEKGSRDIPFYVFLKIIDRLCGRLQFFCETIRFRTDLRTFGLKAFKPNLSEHFFKFPWTPTIYLFLLTAVYKAEATHSDEFVADKLSLTKSQVAESIKTLIDFEMIKFSGAKYEAFSGVFYTPPSLDKKSLEDLNHYWMTQAYEFMRFEGLHKIDQAAVSHESKMKIIGWVSELREKIRLEIATTTPETIVHMHWQVSDILCGEKKK